MPHLSRFVEGSLQVYGAGFGCEMRVLIGIAGMILQNIDLAHASMILVTCPWMRPRPAGLRSLHATPTSLSNMRRHTTCCSLPRTHWAQQQGRNASHRVQQQIHSSHWKCAVHEQFDRVNSPWQ